VLLQAPEGHGKTTALATFVDRAGPSARWLTVNESDQRVEQFVADLVSAIYGWPIEAPAGTDLRDAAKWIVGAIEELGITTVVIDDYETVLPSDAVNALLEELLGKLPPYTQMVIATVSAPPFLRKARLRQSVVELGRSDLQLDADDVSTYLRDLLRCQITDEQAAAVARRSGGCALVVNLVGQLACDLPGYLRVDFDALPIGRSDHEILLLLREVLSRAGFSAAQVARDLSRLDVLHANGSTPAESLLDRLADRNCLALRYPTEPPTVVAHGTLRALASRL
jgi:hypothetical protein